MNFLVSNEGLFFLELLVTFSLIALLYHFLGVEGLYLWIPLSIVLANITVLKQVNMFGIEATLGNIAYASSFLVTDLLSEHYGKSHAKKVVVMGFLSFVLMIVFTQIALLYTPNEFDEVQPFLLGIFSLTPLLLLSSLLAFLISQFHDIWAYHFWKKLLPSRKYLWWRNNASSFVSQLLDTLVFMGLATFFGIFPTEIFWSLFLSTYLIKLLVATCDTPFLYLLSYLHLRKGKKEN